MPIGYFESFLNVTDLSPFITGTAQPKLPQAAMNKVSIPVAPLPEQNRIVAALESYLSRLDDAIASLVRAQRNLKRYRASVLKAAVEGRLVPTEAELAREEGRDYEPASVLLERILVERKARWIEDTAEKGRAKAEEKATKAGKPWTDDDDASALEKERAKATKKYKEPEPPDTKNLPELPEGWCWAPLSGLTIKIVDGTHHTPTYLDEGVAFLSVKDINHGQLSFSKCKFISLEEHERLILRCNPKLGDLLVTKSGTIGRTAVVRSSRPFSLFVSVALLQPVQRVVDARWLEVAFQHWLQQCDISQDVKGTAIKNLHLEDFREMALPLPPLQEQLRIIYEFEVVETRKTKVLEQVDVSVTHIHRLRQSILKWAFEGRLVDQDPNDEPASVLLERIKAERVAMEAKKTPKRDRH
jgi:type I restriction enzyme S subunit